MTCDRVLLVDDEDAFVEAFGDRLNASGLRVETSNSGEDAIAKAERRAFDLAVLDLAMPGMDGIDTLKHLRENHPDRQVILLTGHGSIEKAVQATKLGGMDFLQKPARLTVRSQRMKLFEKERDLLASEKLVEEPWDRTETRIRFTWRTVVVFVFLDHDLYRQRPCIAELPFPFVLISPAIVVSRRNFRYASRTFPYRRWTGHGLSSEHYSRPRKQPDHLLTRSTESRMSNSEIFEASRASRKPPPLPFCDSTKPTSAKFFRNFPR